MSAHSVLDTMLGVLHTLLNLIPVKVLRDIIIVAVVIVVVVIIHILQKKQRSKELR